MVIVQTENDEILYHFRTNRERAFEQILNNHIGLAVLKFVLQGEYFLRSSSSFQLWGFIQQKRKTMKQIIAVCGIRRCGKTYLIRQVLYFFLSFFLSLILL
jgi:predicted AAA+ superfamily ATPase